MRIFKTLIISLFLVCSLCVCAYAKNNVSEINIDVTIRSDGSAYVTQVWDGVFSEGTENYIPINTDGIEISDFKVSDIKGEYTFIESWDINASFSEKSRKCGINKTSDGVELCFGISEYGGNRYAIEYAVHDFIKSYTDYDGSNFMFVNPGMNTFPTDCRISLTLADSTKLDESNSRIWAFGFRGQIEFQNGAVKAYTESPLSGSNSMIVMLQLDKGLVSPLSQENFSFEEVKERAFEGSSYGDTRPLWLQMLIAVGVALLIIAVIAAVCAYIISRIKRKIAIKKFYSDADYYRDIPNGGDIALSYYLSQEFDVAGEKSLIIGATLLSMINNHSLETVTKEKSGVFGKSKTEVSLRLQKEPENEFEKRLYNILLNAAGKDGILQEKELERYIGKRPQALNSFSDSVKSAGERAFTKIGGYTHKSVNRIKYLSERGRTELSEIMGLKKYLLDYSLISEREISEAEIWQDYLVYATLFGIADKVIKQFEKVYPDKSPELEHYNRNIIIVNRYYFTMHNSMQKAMTAQRTSGFGGASSFGGGGGFSGGGHGGGSR